MNDVLSTLAEASRPKAPRIEGVTPKQRRHGGRLASIHLLHLQQIAEVEAIVAQIEAGKALPARAADAVTNLTMVADFRSFGNLCGRECRNLTLHHTAEDERIFPVLSSDGNGALRRVIQRLGQEHRVSVRSRCDDTSIDPLEVGLGRTVHMHAGPVKRLLPPTIALPPQRCHPAKLCPLGLADRSGRIRAFR